MYLRYIAFYSQDGHEEERESYITIFLPGRKLNFLCKIGRKSKLIFFHGKQNYLNDVTFAHKIALTLP